MRVVAVALAFVTAGCSVLGARSTPTRDAAGELRCAAAGPTVDGLLGLMSAFVAVALIQKGRDLDKEGFLAGLGYSYAGGVVGLGAVGLTISALEGSKKIRACKRLIPAAPPEQPEPVAEPEQQPPPPRRPRDPACLAEQQRILKLANAIRDVKRRVEVMRTAPMCGTP